MRLGACMFMSASYDCGGASRGVVPRTVVVLHLWKVQRVEMLKVKFEDHIDLEYARDRVELETAIASLPWYARGILQILGSVDKMVRSRLVADPVGN